MTAVELLYEEIDSIIKLSERKWEEVTRAFERANERHEEQIKDAYRQGVLDVECKTATAEQYYNTKFKTK
jgi:hypothetical protein